MDIVDAQGTRFSFSKPPRRVVSLVPSETDAVFALGCGSLVVGRTDYCVEPVGMVEAIPSVGGTKNASIEKIVSLSPDLVLANQEENTEAIVQGLRTHGITVHVSFPKTVEDGAALVRTLWLLLGSAPEGKTVVQTMEAQLKEAAALREKRVPLRVFVPIWMDPLMTVRGDTFISDMLDLAGGANVFADRTRRYPLAAEFGKVAAWSAEKVGTRDVRYPRISLEELRERAPQVVLLPDEPHPFTEQDAEVFRSMDLPAARDGRVLHCSGKELCWYAPRMGAGVLRLASLLFGDFRG